MAAAATMPALAKDTEPSQNDALVGAENYVASMDQRTDPVWPTDYATDYVPSTRFRGVKMAKRTPVTCPEGVPREIFDEWRLDGSCDTVLNDSKFAPPLLGDVPPRASPYSRQHSRRAIGRVTMPVTDLDPLAHLLMSKSPEYRRAKLESMFWRMPDYAAQILLRMRDLEKETCKMVQLGNRSERLQVQFQCCPRADSFPDAWCKNEWSVLGTPRPVPHTRSMGVVAMDSQGVARPPAFVSVGDSSDDDQLNTQEIMQACRDMVGPMSDEDGDDID